MTDDERRLIDVEKLRYIQEFMEKARDHANICHVITTKMEVLWSSIICGDEPYSDERILEMIEQYISGLDPAVHDISRISTSIYGQFERFLEETDEDE